MLSSLDGHEVSVMKCLRKLQDGPFSQTLPDGPPSSLPFFTVVPDYQATQSRAYPIVGLAYGTYVDMYVVRTVRQPSAHHT